ncbi:MAG: HD domain-containing protein, partial [Clostridia bacterium]|nr:HD domain-containing protein [Clostridia bacterium]
WRTTVDSMRADLEAILAMGYKPLSLEAYLRGETVAGQDYFIVTFDEDVLCAALLHDTVEDTDVTAEDILENFGPDIALLVEHETENKRPGVPPSESWKIRKVESLEVLRTSGTKTKILWVADKLSNMRALAADYEKKGAAAFEKFNVKDLSEQKWYHQSVLEYTAELKEFPAYREYERLFHMIFDNI